MLQLYSDCVHFCAGRGSVFPSARILWRTSSGPHHAVDLGHLPAAAHLQESPGRLAGLSMEQLLEELRQIQQFALLYPSLCEKGPNRVAFVLSTQTLAQQSLAKELGLDVLSKT
jgi:hypothetical protein